MSLITGRDFIFIASIDWGFVWQIHQEIALRLARAGNRVLFVENTGIRSPGIADLKRVAQRFSRVGRALPLRGMRRVATHLHVLSPVVLPPFGPPWRREINRRVLLPVIARAAERLGFRDPIVWSFLPTDTALDLIELVGSARSPVVYYAIADFEALAPHRTSLRHAERQLVARSDLVFTIDEALASRFGALGKTAHLFPAGIDLTRFPVEKPKGAADVSSGLPYELRGLAHPMIGYVGGLHRYVDFNLLATLARARPNWSWVFVGPRQVEVGELATLPNVHLLGQRPHEALADFVRAFDVCLVPYLVEEATATIAPTKLNEYLAMGKPVVSTPLPFVARFEREHRVLHLAPPNPGAFLAAIEAARAEPVTAETSARRRGIASLANWDDRLAAMSELLIAAQR